jgi:hypothetical protein
MAVNKFTLALGVLAVAGLGTTLLWQQLALARLRDQNRALEAQLDQFPLMEREQQRFASALAESSAKSSLPPEQFLELLRLRGEVGLARHLRTENPKLRAENDKLRAAAKIISAPTPQELPDPAEAAFRQETQRRENFLKQWGLMFIVSAADHHGQSPGRWEQMADQMAPEELEFAADKFDIVYQGKLPLDGSQGPVLLFRERAPRRSPSGQWVKVYGFADGHAEVHSEPDGNFAAWEQPRLAGAN